MARSVRFHIASALCIFVGLCWLGTPQARASGPDESVLDVNTLTALETKAAIADPRERCYLYTELLHSWTELAGHALTTGDDTAVGFAMQHADADAARLKVAIGHDSKRLKNAEQLLEHSVHRLSDMARAASLEQHDALLAVLTHVRSVHDDLLAEVFAH